MNKMSWLWILLAATVIVPQAAGAAEPPAEMKGLPLVFQEDFESGTDGWVATDLEAWQVIEEDSNHVLALTQQSKYVPPVRSPQNIMRLEDLDLTDFVLEADLKQTGREYGHRDMCIFFGYQDPSHFYYAHIATKADPHANSIFIVNGEPRLSIAKERTDGTQWKDGHYHHIRLERDTASGTITLYFDDMTKPIMTAEDKTFTHGTIGFGSFDDTGNIDNIRVWAKKNESKE